MQTLLDGSVLEGVEFLLSINLKVQLPYWINLHMDTHTRYRTGAPRHHITAGFVEKVEFLCVVTQL